ETFQPLVKSRCADPSEPFYEIRETARPEEKLANDQQGPPLPNQIERLRQAAVLPVELVRHDSSISLTALHASYRLRKSKLLLRDAQHNGGHFRHLWLPCRADGRRHDDREGGRDLAPVSCGRAAGGAGRFAGGRRGLLLADRSTPHSAARTLRRSTSMRPPRRCPATLSTARFTTRSRSSPATQASPTQRAR